MYNILVCDDEKDIVTALRIYLESDGYHVLTAENGKDAIELVKKEQLHLVVMDIMMPEMDGITAMVEIRRFSNIPVILLTAKSEDTDKILGLNVGADDYVTKPFNPVELLARVRSQLRRYTQLGSARLKTDSIRIRGLEMDLRSMEAFLDGEKINLTKTEYEILHLLMENPGKVFSPKEIYETVWKETMIGTDNTVAVHIRHLREKIEIDPSNPRYLKVVWGRGYKLED